MAITDTGNLPEGLLDVFSMDILHDALARVTWWDFAVIRDDLSVSPGETLQFTKYADLGGNPELTEGVDLVDKALSASRISITVTEYGASVALSEKLLSLSWDDLLEEAATELGRHYTTWGPDFKLKDTAQLGAATTIYGGGAANRAAITSADVFDTTLVRDAVEILQSGNVPKFNRGGDQFYVCVCHPRQLRYLRQDADWEDAHRYVDPSNIYNGEAGRFEGVVFVSSTQVYNGTQVDDTDPRLGVTYLDSAGTPGSNALRALIDGNAVNVYMATLFGDMYYAFAMQKPVELRQKQMEDYGRKHGLMWYSIYGAGILHGEHAVSIETA